MITVEEVEDAARQYATGIIERFNQSPDSAIRDLLAAAYVAGASCVLKSMLAQPSQEVATNAH